MERGFSWRAVMAIRVWGLGFRVVCIGFRIRVTTTTNR